MLGVESFENSQGENEDDQEDDEEWPEMPSTESIQQNFNTNNQQQATFSTFRPQSKSILTSFMTISSKLG